MRRVSGNTHGNLHILGSSFSLGKTGGGGGGGGEGWGEEKEEEMALNSDQIRFP